MPLGARMIWASFTIGDEQFCQDVSSVREVFTYTEPTPVPGACSEIIGVHNFRGYIITIIDVRTAFHLPSKEPDEETRIIALEHENEVYGFVVDTIETTTSFEKDEIYRGSGEEEYILGTIHQEDSELMIVVDLHVLLGMIKQKQVPMLA